jgi:hypothetical protein
VGQGGAERDGGGAGEGEPRRARDAMGGAVRARRHAAQGGPRRGRARAEPHRGRRPEKGRRRGEGVLTARDEGGAGSEIGGGDMCEGRGEGEREKGFGGG